MYRPLGRAAGLRLYDGTLRIKHKGQGINQMARIGTFAEEVVVPEEMVVPIRKDMPWPQAALVGCCVATGVGAVRATPRSRPAPPCW